jgi:RHS repeat-associated protein
LWLQNCSIPRFFHEFAADKVFIPTDAGAVMPPVSPSSARSPADYRYDAFGEAIGQTGTTDNTYRFAGEQFDEGLGDYYLRQRYYDTSSGRFTRRDTYAGRQAEPLTLHKYLYANANPGNLSDPSGLFAMSMTDVNLVLQTVTVLALMQYNTIQTGSYQPEKLGGFGEDSRPPTILDAIFAWKNTWTPEPLGGMEGVKPNFSNHTGHSRNLDDFISYVFTADTSELRKNMANDGRSVPADYSAHHIIPGNLQRAADARAILASKGIDVNDAENGVSLRTQSGHPDSHKGRGLHSNAAIAEIMRRIEPLDAEETRAELRAIGQEMRSGNFNF